MVEKTFSEGTPSAHHGLWVYIMQNDVLSSFSKAGQAGSRQCARSKSYLNHYNSESRIAIQHEPTVFPRELLAPANCIPLTRNIQHARYTAHSGYLDVDFTSDSRWQGRDADLPETYPSNHALDNFLMKRDQALFLEYVSCSIGSVP